MEPPWSVRVRQLAVVEQRRRARLRHGDQLRTNAGVCDRCLRGCSGPMRQPASRLLQERSEDVECAREIGSPMHHDKNGIALDLPIR